MKLNLSLAILGTAFVVSSAVSNTPLIPYSQLSPSAPAVASQISSRVTPLVLKQTPPTRPQIATPKHLKQLLKSIS